MDNLKLQPQNIEAERAVVGSILVDKDSLVKIADFLKPQFFYNDKLRLIYEVMLDLYDKREPIDIITVPDRLKKLGHLDKVGGVGEITELINQTPTTQNIQSYAKLIRDAYVRRSMIQISSEIGSMGYDEAQDVEDLLDVAETKLFGISKDNIKGEFVSIRRTLEESFDIIDDLYRNKDKMRGVPTGFKTLDQKLNGMRAGNLIIVAARPSVGKSALLLNMAQFAAVNHKIPVALFSLEMGTIDLGIRMVSSQARIDGFKITSGRLSDEELGAYGEAAGILADAPIYIDDTPSLSIMELRTKARRIKADKGIEIVMVDYLQLMRGRSTENRVQEVSEISWGLKALAKELNIPVVAAAQLNRSVAHREGLPQLSDLRESGCLSGETLIYLPDKGSYIPIKDLEGKKDFNITSLNTETWKLETGKVSEAFCTGIKPVYEMTTALGRKIKATANHKFLTINGWKRLDEIKIRDHIAIPRHLPNVENQTMTPASLALLGHLIGDGCTLPRHVIQYTTREHDLAKIVVDLAKQVFGDLINPRISVERDWYQVYLSANYHLTRGISNPISIWLKNMKMFGLRSYEKFIPDEVFQQSLSGITIFLRHLWSTDGCIRMIYGKSVRPAIYYASSSERLAYGIQSLLLRLNINTRVAKKPQSKGRVQYHIIVSGQSDIQKFISQIGTIGQYKQRSLAEIVIITANKLENTNRDILPSSIWRSDIVPSMQNIEMTSREMQFQLGMEYCGTALYKANLSRNRALKVAEIVKSDKVITLAQSDIYWDKVISIELTGSEKVYDLTVPGNHNFIAGNIIAHNSIEQDADVVMFLHRPDEENRNEVLLAVAKHRNGPTGVIPMFFRGERTTFYEQTSKPEN